MRARRAENPEQTGNSSIVARLRRGLGAVGHSCIVPYCWTTLEVKGIVGHLVHFSSGQEARDAHKVTAQRTAVDFAYCMRDLVDVHFPEAEVVRVVMDNLNTHTPGSLYKVFAPEEARRILRKLEFHFTPKHGSWLNMAEIELSVLTGQCLDRRLPDMDSVGRETGAWVKERNNSGATVTWRFTSASARTKLQRLYPSPSAR
jgi:hypothetical protein